MNLIMNTSSLFIDKLVNLDRQYCIFVLLLVLAWGGNVRSTDGIGLQKRGSHLTAKCANTLVLIDSTTQLCANQ